MASTYSDLKIELIGTGDQTGTWGTTTNNNFSVAFQEAITGSADVAFSSADVTVTLTDTNAAQTARNLRLNLTGTSGGARNLILGSGCQIEKLYLVNNGLADAVTVKNTTGTGIIVPAGASMFVYNNGTNVVEVLKAIPVAAGGTGLATLTANNVLIGNGTSNVSFVAPGSNGNVLTSNGTTWASSAPASQVYPGAGIANSTGSAWGTSYTTSGSGTVVALQTTPVFIASRVTVSALGTLTTGTTTIDLATAQVYTATITASNTITIAFSNAPSAGQSQIVLLRLTDAGGGTIVWPANTKFSAGTAPTLTASGVDVIGVYYDVTTTTYMVFVIGLDVKVP